MTTAKLIPLKDIPAEDRSIERETRARLGNPKNAMIFCVQDAPGTYSGRPHKIGWTATQSAAKSYCLHNQAKHPDGSTYRLYTYV